MELGYDIDLIILSYLSYTDIISCIQAGILNDEEELWDLLIKRRHNLTLRSPCLEDLKILEMGIEREDVMADLYSSITNHMNIIEEKSTAPLSYWHFKKETISLDGKIFFVKTSAGALSLISKYIDIFQWISYDPANIRLPNIINARCNSIIQELNERIISGNIIEIPTGSVEESYIGDELNLTHKVIHQLETMLINYPKIEILNI